MEARVHIVPWLEGRCSMYAVVRDGVCLIDEFIGTLRNHDADAADDLVYVLEWLSREQLIRQAYLRPERPEIGVYAMFNHLEMPTPTYNPSRVLCSYVQNSNTAMILGAGFLKTKYEPI